MSGDLTFSAGIKEAKNLLEVVENGAIPVLILFILSQNIHLDPNNYQILYIYKIKKIA